jgi:hypothetical protein
LCPITVGCAGPDYCYNIGFIQFPGLFVFAKVNRLLVGLWLFFAGAGAWAVVVTDLYSAEVAVPDRSQDALSAAAAQALGQVLVKVSGREAVLAEPALAPLLEQPRQYLQQFSYRRSPAPDSGLVAQLQFDERAMRPVLAEAGVPLWTANRPVVLLWLVAESPQGRYFINRDSHPELSAQVVADFALRGVPVELPLYDLTDAATIGPDDVWRLSGSALELASARYNSEHILAGRLAGLSSGSWIGDWAYLSDRGRLDRSYTTDSAAAFVASGVHLVAESLAQRYAVVASGDVAAGVMLTVDGLEDFADYKALVSWLEGLEMVRRADLQTLEGARATLRLATAADAAQLAPSIELNRHLLPQPGASAESALVYRWQN